VRANQCVTSTPIAESFYLWHNPAFCKSVLQNFFSHNIQQKQKSKQKAIHKECTNNQKIVPTPLLHAKALSTIFPMLVGDTDRPSSRLTKTIRPTTASSSSCLPKGCVKKLVTYGRSFSVSIKSKIGHGRCGRIVILSFFLFVILQAMMLSMMVIRGGASMFRPSSGEDIEGKFLLPKERLYLNETHLDKFCRDTHWATADAFSLIGAGAEGQVKFALELNKILDEVDQSSVVSEVRNLLNHAVDDLMREKLPKSFHDEFEWLRFSSKRTREFIKLLSGVTKVMGEVQAQSEELKKKYFISDSMLWRGCICRGTFMAKMFRQYVKLEHELFSWMFVNGSLNSYGSSKECYYRFANTSIPHGKCNATLGYVSPVWQTYNAVMTAPKSTRGYVLCVGNVHMSFVVGLLWNIRYHYASKTPIEIFYMGENDLSPQNREVLKSFGGISVHNIYDYFDNNTIHFGKFDVKPFAILASNFTEVALIDADVGFLQHPDSVFRLKSYQRAGAHFFHDRTMPYTTPRSSNVLGAVTTNPSYVARKTRTWFNLTEHEQESGVVVINKKTRFAGILGVTRLNDYHERRILHANTHGDKESYWLGFEMVGETYAFTDYYPGSIGFKNKEQTCGRMVHFDDSGMPFWWNGGFKNAEKHVEGYTWLEWLDMKDFDDGGHVGDGHVSKWTSEGKDGNHNYCVANSKRGSRKLPEVLAENARSAVLTYSALSGI
jgi:hypothetical protein